MNNPQYIVIHCTDFSESLRYDQLNQTNSYHKSEGFPKSSLGYYVGYHYLITGGKEYQCRLDTDVGAHCNSSVNSLSMNYQSIGVCWGGDGDVEYPSPEHYRLLKERIRALMRDFGIPKENVRFHRAFNTKKTCPGSLLTEEWLNNLLKDDVVKASTCSVEKEEITELKKQLSWYDELLKWFNRG